jgi:metal-responsive CopG/Arc/MetJ family transcriptional regulator
MKRATISFPNDLAEALESYVAAQEVPPALTSVVQTALRHYLTERGFLKTRRNLGITPARKGSGRSDGSQQHDRYLVGRQK